ncbi:MAG TPA: cellulase family glycosylhydrolase, partial [Spirochaetota bacterium]
MMLCSKRVGLFFVIVVISVIVGSLGLLAKNQNTAWVPSDYIQTDGTLLRDPSGKQFLIKGVSFGNHVWTNPETSSWFTEHSALDYGRIKGMGFNAVRFYINYGLFESDADPYKYKQSGFDWLDKNIADARASGIYLVINMHYPQGGFQSNGA